MKNCCDNSGAYRLKVVIVWCVLKPCSGHSRTGCLRYFSAWDPYQGMFFSNDIVWYTRIVLFVLVMHMLNHIIGTINPLTGSSSRTSIAKLQHLLGVEATVPWVQYSLLGGDRMMHVEALQWLNWIFAGRLRAKCHQLWELGNATTNTNNNSNATNNNANNNELIITTNNTNHHHIHNHDTHDTHNIR